MVLNYISLIISNVKHIFMYLWALCMPYLEKKSFQVLYPFLIEFFGLFDSELHVWVICIFYINSSVSSFANLFSYSIVCLLVCWYFPLLCGSFHVFKSHLIIFAFTSVLGVWLGKYCVCLWHTLLGFLWFHVLCLLFKPFWVYLCRWCEGMF